MFVYNVIVLFGKYIHVPIFFFRHQKQHIKLHYRFYRISVAHVTKCMIAPTTDLALSYVLSTMNLTTLWVTYHLQKLLC